ncbi:ExbD/TolR family protein [Sphingomonas jatrophae]|uniref:Outer membrane transport energization protein ExbD n=1 Tax=Sphingomonas jatrophae TaxID=1166337 RepID=A0A1I6M5U7_9SPHN|nr:biopolymer transporter ExbD [Sphingomonas jatrophae]SFS11095.1 outer membrane transport energization protein ExbD [Sphingomonas jatrophae]
MAMSAGPADDDSPMSDINTTPLVDVMLVLLIIFLITVPVAIQTVPVKLPNVVFEPTVSKPENVVLSVRGGPGGACEVYWGQTPVTPQELLDRAVTKLKLEIDKQGGPTAAGLELPEAHIRGDINTPWRCVGGAMTNLQRAGFIRVGFISEPPAGTVNPRL